jgi:hypothetical protein
MSVSQSPKTYHLYGEWENDLFFTMFRDKCVCLTCRASVALAKKKNLERHFSSIHKKYNLNVPPKSEIRKIKVKDFKAQLGAQQLHLLNLFCCPKQQLKHPVVLQIF